MKLQDFDPAVLECVEYDGMPSHCRADMLASLHVGIRFALDHPAEAALWAERMEIAARTLLPPTDSEGFHHIIGQMGDAVAERCRNLLSVRPSKAH